MIDLLKTQYTFLQGSRQALLNFVENQVGPDLNTPIAAFDGRTIRYLLVHIGGCYHHWLEKFAVKRDYEKLNEEDFETIASIRAMFDGVNKTMTQFLTDFAEKLNDPIIRTLLPEQRKVSATALEIFTHVVTHEFHHKGQILTMCRLLGYPPPDTDIIRF